MSFIYDFWKIDRRKLFVLRIVQFNLLIRRSHFCYLLVFVPRQIYFQIVDRTFVCVRSYWGLWRQGFSSPCYNVVLFCILLDIDFWFYRFAFVTQKKHKFHTRKGSFTQLNLSYPFANLKIQGINPCKKSEWSNCVL